MGMTADGDGSNTRPLREVFFQPQLVTSGAVVDGVLLGAAASAMQRIDGIVVPSLRNRLFNEAPLHDLPARNIERGRDHHIPHFRALQAAYGTGETAFADLPEAVRNAYATAPNDEAVDPWVGGITEQASGNSKVGPLFQAIIADQFARSRNADRFYYEHDPMVSHRLRAFIKSQRLHHVLRRNLPATANVREDVFRRVQN